MAKCLQEWQINDGFYLNWAIAFDDSKEPVQRQFPTWASFDLG
ncbi:hypothetical protein [Microseira wollei]|nr:hypothetical protein [Microseira wollei]